MPGRTALRLAILAVEAAFIVAVAVVGAVEGLGWWTLAPVAGAWALTVLSERLVSRFVPEPGARASSPAVPAAAASATAAAEPALEIESHVRVVRKEPAAPAQPEPVAPAAVEDGGLAPEQPVEMPVTERPAEPVAVSEPEAEPQPEPEPQPEAEPQPEPEPEQTPEAEQEPEPVAAAPVEPAPAPAPFVPPVLTSVPPLAPAPEPVAAQLAAQSDVIQLEPRGPRGWNIWDLERLTKEHAGVDAARDEERSYLLVYLREFASADGLLPLDFDALVRESFGELVGAG